MKSTHAFAFAVVLVAQSAFCELAAQLPPGWIVAASFQSNGNLPPTGDGGLYLIHPRTPGAPITVQGLSPELTGIGVSTSQSYGANSVAVLPDGDILVGEIAVSGQVLDIHRIRLQRVAQGWTGNLVQKYAIGTVGGGAQIDDIEVLPGNRALIARSGAVSGPMSVASVGTLDLASGAITPLSLSVPTSVNALSLSEDAQTYYLGEFMTSSGRVWSVPSSGGRATVINQTVFPGGVMALDRDNAGNLVVGTIGSTGANPFGTPPNLHVVDVATGSWTNLANAQVVRNGLIVERNTGMIVTGGVNQSISLIDPVTAQETQLGTFVNGVMAGLAQVPAVESFGQQSGGSAPYAWQTAPNPDGLPLVGASGFAVTVDTTTQPLVGIAAFSFGTANLPNLPVHGATLLLDPVSLQWWNLVLGTPPFQVVLPIPNQPVFAGVDVFGQTFHLDNSGATSSPGIRITVL